MSGVSELNKQGLDRIEKVLNGKENYYRGFINFMNDSSVQTRYYYLCHVCAFMEYVNKEPSTLTFDDFNNYMMKISYKEDGSMMTSSYRINIYSALKKFNEYLCVSGKLNKNTQFFMRDIKRPKQKESKETIEKREKSFLTEREIQKCVDQIDSYMDSDQSGWIFRDKAIIYTLLTTGIRNSALRALDVGDVDLKNNTLTVTDKGGKVKTYQMSENLACAIDNWLIVRDVLADPEMYEEGKYQETNALFISQRRTRMSTVALNKVVQKYASEIDGKHITPHKLRATYGTQLYNKTGDIYFVQQCMGHSNPKTTELYVREKKQNTKRASDIMDKLL